MLNTNAANAKLILAHVDVCPVKILNNLLRLHQILLFHPTLILLCQRMIVMIIFTPIKTWKTYLIEIFNKFIETNVRYGIFYACTVNPLKVLDSYFSKVFSFLNFYSSDPVLKYSSRFFSFILFISRLGLIIKQTMNNYRALTWLKLKI